MGDALDQVRKRLWNQARREGDKKTTGTMRGLKYALLKNPDDLTDRQNTALATLGDVDPRGQLYRAWQLKELLRTLLRQPVEQAEAELKRWIGWASRCRIPEVTDLCGKIRRRRDDILRTIRLGYSNARLEAFNNVFCQVVIGQCGVSFPSEKAVGFSPVRNWPVIARVLLFHCIRA